MSAKPQCSADVHDDYGVRFHQCTRNATVQRNGAWFCGTHDPEKVRARNEMRGAKYDARRREQAAVESEAKRLAQRLGVRGKAEYNAFGRPAGYVRGLVIPFEDVERLLREVER